MISVVRFGVVLGALLIALLPTRAEAVSYTFTSCFDNNSGVCSQLASQLQVEVTGGDTFVDFKFTNDIGIESSVTALYFDAAGYFTDMAIKKEVGVDFNVGSANPDNPPGGSTAVPPFEVTQSLLAGATAPPSQNGINSSTDYLTVRFTLAEGQTFDSIIAALNEGVTSDDGIRIAAHVQGINGGPSDTFICCSGDGGGGGGGTPSPEPASLGLFALAALAAGHRLRRRRALA